MKQLIPFITALFLIAGCQQPPQQQEAKPSLVEVNNSQQQMDMLEHLFSNDNWMKVINHDTSYYYFSRNQLMMKVYNYQLRKGDSANTIISEIKVRNDNLQWSNGEMVLQLTQVDSSKATWENLKDTAQKKVIILQKQTGNRLKVIGGKESCFLIKTLPLATFFIRSHYDYLHGTALAFSDTIFKPAKKK